MSFTVSTSDLSIVTQYEIMQRKREDLKAKARLRMARYRLRMKERPPAEQEAANARARRARARYRESQRGQFRETEAAFARYAAEQLSKLCQAAARPYSQQADDCRCQHADGMNGGDAHVLI
ncbi:hypothetical protein C8R43DRAFT_1138103 [Mycena crocata]|nr:hypothetical protein C8R43DRAFT_1138103 [Mycena crocata]